MHFESFPHVHSGITRLAPFLCQSKTNGRYLVHAQSPDYQPQPIYTPSLLTLHTTESQNCAIYLSLSFKILKNLQKQ